MALTGLTNLQPLHIKTVGIGTFDNTVSIGGTLTYEDVTNVDAIGIITARDDINIITDGKKLNIGASADLQLHHTSNHSYIDDAGAGNLRLRSGTLEIQNLASSKTSAVFSSGGGQTLNFNNQTKFVTTNTGVVITGICTATSFSGDGSNLTGISAGVSVANQADNRLITATGTTDALNGESGLTYTSNILDVNNAVRLPDEGTVHFGVADTAYVRGKDSTDGYVKIGTVGAEVAIFTPEKTLRMNQCPALETTAGSINITGGGSGGRIAIQGTSSSAGAGLAEIFAFWGTNKVAGIIALSGADTTNKDDGQLLFYTSSSGPAVTERLRITSAGAVQLNADTGSRYFSVGANQDFKWYHDAGGPTIFSDTGNQGLKLSIRDLNITEYSGVTTRLKIDNSGRIGINASPTGHEYLKISPIGNNVLDLRYELNSDTDIRHKFYDNTGTQRGTFGYTTYANSSTYPNFHDSFYLQTDPGSNGSLATVMWINRDGQFIKPYTYQFLVETNGTSVSGGWNKLTGLTIDSTHSTGVSNGTYWSNSNQRFTAPVSGTYNFFIGGFSGTAEGGGTNHRYMYSFVINGSGLEYGCGGNYSDNNTPMEGGSICYKLNVNDYVEIYYYTAISATWGAGHRFFWGGYFLG